MKIQTNLASRRLQLRKRLVAASWGVSLGVLTLTIGITIKVYETHIDARRLEAELSRLDQELASRQSEYDVWQAQSHVLRGANVERLARVDFGQGPAAPQLLEELERLAPREVHLIRYQHDRVAGKIEMVASARGPDGITALMRRLEANKLLSRAVLADQQSRERSGKRMVEAKIILTLTGERQ